MNPLASLLGQQWAYGALVFVLAATVFGFAWQYYEAVLKENVPDRDKLVDRLAKGGGPRAFYISQMSAMLDRVDGLFARRCRAGTRLGGAAARFAQCAALLDRQVVRYLRLAGARVSVREPVGDMAARRRRRTGR
jgi:hypothetical protein